MESGELTTSARECTHVIVVRTSTVNIDVCSTSVVVAGAVGALPVSSSSSSFSVAAADGAGGGAAAAAVVATVVVEELRGVMKMGCMPQINGTITALTHMAKG